MFGIVWTYAVQLVNEVTGERLRAREFRPAMNDTMTDAGNRVEAVVFSEPGDDEFAACAMAGSFDTDFLGITVFIFDREGRIGKADAFEFAGDEAVQ